MKKKVFPRRIVLSALHMVNADEDALREDYSGRFMYENTCFGVVLPAPIVMMFVYRLAGECHEQGLQELGAEMIHVADVDDMARNMIVYFQGWELSKD